MKLKTFLFWSQISIFLTIATLCPATLFAQQSGSRQGGPVTVQQFRQVLTDLMQSIEETAGLERLASQALSATSEEDMQMFYESWRNKEQFIYSAQKILSHIQAARATATRRYGYSAPLQSLSSPYSPEYPMGYPYAYLKLFGIIDSPDDRCSAEWLEYYRSAVAGAEASVYFFERLSAMAQCDPLGAICISFAIPVETAKLVLQTAKVPLTLCDTHIAGVDSAEIEAGYENSVKILSDLASQASTANNILNALAAHDAHINGDLAAHDTQVKNQLSVHDGDIKGLLNQLKNQLSTLDTDIKGLLAIVLANQAEIIKLLKTPEGRRPGWQKDGY